MILCPIHSFKCLLCCRVITCSKSFYVFGSYKVGVGGIFRHQSFIYKFFIHILVNLRRLLPIAKLQFHSIQFNPIFYEESMGQVPLYFSCKLLFRCPDSLSLSLSSSATDSHFFHRLRPGEVGGRAAGSRSAYPWRRTSRSLGWSPRLSLLVGNASALSSTSAAAAAHLQLR